MAGEPASGAGGEIAEGDDMSDQITKRKQTIMEMAIIGGLLIFVMGLVAGMLIGRFF